MILEIPQTYNQLNLTIFNLNSGIQQSYLSVSTTGHNWGELTL